jgi:hypothetical protein
MENDFVSSSDAPPRRRKKHRRDTEPVELHLERGSALTIRGKREQMILSHHRQTQFSMPPAKRSHAKRDRTVSLNDPQVLNSANLRDVNAIYRGSVRHAQHQLSFINQSISGMLLTRKLREQNPTPERITLEGTRREIEARIAQRRRANPVPYDLDEE